jgi:hypothetical protein
MPLSRSPFVQTEHCRSGVHCATCRDRDGGRDWRKSAAQVFAVPEIDWECPRGLAWGYAPEGAAKKTSAETVCRHRGAARPDRPHSGPCCLPYECRHEATPEIVSKRICGAGKCKFYVQKSL